MRGLLPPLLYGPTCECRLFRCYMQWKYLLEFPYPTTVANLKLAVRFFSGSVRSGLGRAKTK